MARWIIGLVLGAVLVVAGVHGIFTHQQFHGRGDVGPVLNGWQITALGAVTVALCLWSILTRRRK